jgi:hypothetical protein
VVNGVVVGVEATAAAAAAKEEMVDGLEAVLVVGMGITIKNLGMDITIEVGAVIGVGIKEGIPKKMASRGTIGMVSALVPD